MSSAMNSKSTKSMSTSSVESFNQRSSQKRLLHSDSSVSYQFSNLPPYFREDSLKEIISRNAATYLNDDADLETTTSKSFFHGVILVSIMISSLIAFICSKVRRCASYVDVTSYEDCSKYYLFYSIMTISSCLVTFLIYFLHLISQCDILCLTRKKYEFEIITIASICSLLLVSSICYLSHTDVLAESFTLTSFLLTSLTVVLYIVRIVILVYEMVSRRGQMKKRSIHRRVVRSLNTSRQSSSKESTPALNSDLNAANNNLPPTKVVSYVRNSQRDKMFSTSMSDDFEDDVFIQ